jgi:hypothetical protein
LYKAVPVPPEMVSSMAFELLPDLEYFRPETVFTAFCEQVMKAVGEAVQ